MPGHPGIAGILDGRALLDAIRELVSTDSGDGTVLLHDGTELKLSRTYRNALYSELNVDS